jgi:hypothetical protein
MVKKYKLIIAGSRSISDMKVLEKAITYFDIKVEDIKEVVSGLAFGVDTLGKWWGEKHNIPVKEFPAKWNDLETPPVYIKENKHGKYNCLAGIVRNKQMGDYADKLLCIWDGESKGSEQMIEYMKELKKEVMVYEV